MIGFQNIPNAATPSCGTLLITQLFDAMSDLGYCSIGVAESLRFRVDTAARPSDKDSNCFEDGGREHLKSCPLRTVPNRHSAKLWRNIASPGLDL
jgi:hypothetical protein